MNRDDAKTFLTAGVIAAFVLLVAVGTAGAAEVVISRQAPSAAFCWIARRAVDIAGSEKAAEAKARTEGVSEETIAKAKRCTR
jgi:hypothetical protein